MKDQKVVDKKDRKNNNPDDTGSVYVEGHIKIFDPENEEVFVDKRG